ncbi:hypothetical protein Tco_0860506 [Tanacetum coccineum]|uniref:Eukaryotic translation initiation factor 3 subunit G N-terminal domain-containing protein n=1 Tax=Tanacetum coccineum TaxID=301880 RepID=A0ABQ5BKU8_9ASTR
MFEYSQKWHNGTTRTKSTETSDGLAAIQAQLNNIRRKIKKVNEKVYATQVGCEQCKGPHYTKDCPLKEEKKTLEEAYYTQFDGPFQEGGYRAIASGFYQRNNANPSKEDFGSLPSSTETNPRDHVKSISTIVEADAKAVFPENTPYWITPIHHKKGSYGPKFSKAYSCEASHIDKSIPRKEKDPGSFTLPCYINNVCFDNALADLGANRTVKYPKGIAENVLVEARLMGETLVLNRSLDIFFEDYIELNDLNVPLELRRDQVDDLMPTIEEGEVVKEFRARNDVRMVSKNFGYPTECDHDKKIHFSVLEDMDAYRDEGMGDVIFGEPFLREVRINADGF